jgi:hypothetical protein
VAKNHLLELMNESASRVLDYMAWLLRRTLPGMPHRVVF